MSVKIRLARTGKKHRISFRIVVQDTLSKRDSNFLEILGYYLPYEKKAKNFDIKRDRVSYWISKGAKPTLSVSKLLDEKNNGRSNNKSA